MAGTRYYSYTPKKATLRGAAELSKLYGNVNYDEAKIKQTFDTATNEAYKVKQKEYQQAENAYYDQMANQQFSTVDAIRRANAQAIASGAAKGMQAANELSSVLGLQQEAATGATNLATDRQKIVDEHTAALAQNAVTALEAANKAKLDLGQLSADIYGYDAQQFAAEAGFWQGLEEAAAALTGVKAQADATKYAADRSAQAQIEAAAKNIGAQQAYSEYLYKKDPVAWAMQVMGLSQKDAKAYIAEKNKSWFDPTVVGKVINDTTKKASTNSNTISNRSFFDRLFGTGGADYFGVK